MSKVSWERALLRGLKEEGFTGTLTMTYKNGVVTGTSFDPTLASKPRKARKQRATVEHLGEQAATAGA